MRTLLLFISISAIIATAHGQSDEPKSDPKFGLGLKVARYELVYNDIYSNDGTGDILLCYNLNHKYKIETEIGFLYLKSDEKIWEITNTISGVRLGLNLYRLVYMDRLCINYGIKIGYHFMNNKEKL